MPARAPEAGVAPPEQKRSGVTQSEVLETAALDMSRVPVGEPSSVTPQVIVRQDEKLVEEIKALKDSLKNTEGLLEHARSELDARIGEHKDKAYEDGYEAGKNEGLANGRAEFDQQTARLSAVVDELATLKAHVIESADPISGCVVWNIELQVKQVKPSGMPYRSTTILPRATGQWLLL